MKAMTVSRLSIYLVRQAGLEACVRGESSSIRIGTTVKGDVVTVRVKGTVLKVVVPTLGVCSV